MPMFKPKSPDLFPWPFHEAFRQALQRFAADPDLTSFDLAIEMRINKDTAHERAPKWVNGAKVTRQPKELILVEQKRVSAFKSMIKRHPFHAHNELLEIATIRAKPEMFQDGWGLRLTFTRDSRIRDCFQAALDK